MRCHTEQHEVVARADTLEELAAFVESEMVEPYVDVDDSVFHGGDHRYHKFFRKGGPLEWCNKPQGDGWGYKEVIDVGTREDWMRRAGESWDKEILVIPAPVMGLAEGASSGKLDRSVVDMWQQNLVHH